MRTEYVHVWRDALDTLIYLSPAILNIRQITYYNFHDRFSRKHFFNLKIAGIPDFFLPLSAHACIHGSKKKESSKCNGKGERTPDVSKKRENVHSAEPQQPRTLSKIKHKIADWTRTTATAIWKWLKLIFAENKRKKHTHQNRSSTVHESLISYLQN